MEINLSINTELARSILTRWIGTEVTRAGFQHAVVALSGGIDSALSCYLAAEALGPHNVLAVRMPYKTSSTDSLEHAQVVIDTLGVQSITIPITDMADGLVNQFPEMSSVRKGNIMARCRMITIYDQSEAFRGLVIGTGNKTESLIGYTTIWGDSACAFNPIGDLYKSQVRQLASAVGVPDAIIRKAPSADLWPGQTDEAEADFSYPVLDRILYWLIDRRRSPDEVAAMGFAPDLVARVERMVAAAEFKRQVPPVAKLGPRTTGVDYLYPRRRPGSARS